MTDYKLRTRVVSVKEREQLVRAYKSNPNDPNSEIVQEKKTLGWFAHFDGSWESLFLGTEKPDLKAGDAVEITIRRLA